jgi:hypothetical protein
MPPRRPRRPRKKAKSSGARAQRFSKPRRAAKTKPRKRPGSPRRTQAAKRSSTGAHVRASAANRARRRRSATPAVATRSERTTTGARQKETRNRALHALAHMLRGESLSTAARLEHIKPSSVLRHVGTAISRDKPGGRYRARSKDKFIRELEVPSASGRVAVDAKGIAKAREYSDYANAVAHFNRTGDLSRLERFKEKAFVDVSGQRHEFVTDRETLTTLADAGIPLESFYRSIAPRP